MVPSSLAGVPPGFAPKDVVDATFTNVSDINDWNWNTRIGWDDAWKKAGELVDTLTLEERVKVVSGLGWQTGACVGNIAAVPKINFPGLCLQDSPAGIRYAWNVSAFPASINVAATFDKKLMYRHGLLMGDEARQKGINVLLAPVANMMRTPEGGRNWEGQGADPYLTGVSAAMQVRGIQDRGVQATVKHFIGNEQEHFRDGGDTIIDVKTLMEIYARPFKFAVDAGVTSVMCSYNKINGTYACENPSVLNDVLKSQLGFKAYVMSDWWASHTTAESANAGLDMVMPGSTSFLVKDEWWGAKLVAAVNSGSVKADRIADMARRVLAGWIKLGQDKDFPATNFNSFKPGSLPAVNVEGNHRKHIREVGAASTVLVRHVKNALPLKADKYKKIAIIGSDAKTGTLNSFLDNAGVPDGTLAQGWGSGTTVFPYLVSPIDGITAQAAENGMTVTAFTDNFDLDGVRKASSEADVSVVFVNSNSGEGYLTVDNNLGDRNNLTLWLNGDAIIYTAATQSKTIVVIHSPGPVDMEPWVSHPNVTGVLYALFPGQESGNAIADVLFGKVNPSGRLPFSIMKKRADYAASVEYNSSTVTYTEGLFGDYRGEGKRNVTALYTFGHGLSYTAFEYSNLKVVSVSPANANITGRAYPLVATVTVNVKNTGDVDGYEVPQLYVRLPDPGEPVKWLKGFERVFVGAGKSVDVSFDLDEEDLSVFDGVKGGWGRVGGKVGVMVGASSLDVRLTGEFEVTAKGVVTVVDGGSKPSGTLRLVCGWSVAVGVAVSVGSFVGFL
ncbi:hypothetical protein HDU97_007817 [Phlyctochytrium planicorne]|nr:hypothetical protein HDU97_007817 [Phlyctochytrium planicorne]